MGSVGHTLVNASLDIPKTFLSSEYYGTQSSKNIFRNLAAAAVRDSIYEIAIDKWKRFPGVIHLDEVYYARCNEIEETYRTFYALLQ